MKFELWGFAITRVVLKDDIILPILYYFYTVIIADIDVHRISGLGSIHAPVNLAVVQ